MSYRYRDRSGEIQTVTPANQPCDQPVFGPVYHFGDDDSKDQFLKIVRAYEDLLGVEVLTFCIMSNHFHLLHLLVRVPHRPEGFDVSLEVILARMEREIGDEAMALVRIAKPSKAAAALIENAEQKASARHRCGDSMPSGT